MQTMRMCAAFAEAGADVTLVHPRTSGEVIEGFSGDVSAFYGVRPTFRRRQLAGPTLQRLARLRGAARPVRAVMLAIEVVRLAWRRDDAILYTRSNIAAWLGVALRRALRSPLRVAVEVHDLPPGPRALRNLRGADAIVAISGNLASALAAQAPELAGRILVEHDGVDLRASDVRGVDRDNARRELGLETRTGPVVLYTGRAIAGKGVEMLVRAAPRLVEEIDATVVVVGKVYIDEVLESPFVTFTGFVPPAAVPLHIAAADVLVMPTTEDLAYAAYTSPLKLFEYMASGRPMVASALTTVKEVLEDGRNALLYPPADPDALAAAAIRLWRDPALRERIARQAFDDVQEYAWERRAARILAGLGHVGPAPGG